MKKIAVIYKNRDNPSVINYLKNSLEKIFEKYVIIENHYLSEIHPGVVLDANVYIVMYESMLFQIKGIIKNYNNVIIMGRSLKKKYLHKVAQIPRNTNVLVVNDTYETTMQTLSSLYELGMNHINLIPFDINEKNPNKYSNFNICITPNEVLLAPSHIKNVINIGYREISFDTLVQLMYRLNLNLEPTNRNLVHHIRSLAHPDIYFYNNYLTNFVKNYAFDIVINNSHTALIVTNELYSVLFSNNKANSLFNINSNMSNFLLSNIMSMDVYNIIKKECIPKNNVILNGVTYFIKKTPIKLIDEIIGYCITFEHEKDIRDMEIHSKKIFEENGLYAKYNFNDIIHVSHSMKKCINTAKVVALTNHTILITGESGTGKELMAQSIHNYSRRKKMPFIAINCAALPESLLESELFGYESGSFTGAKKNGKLGLFEQANGGTLMLDEIGDISLSLQARLLRVLQEQQIMRIGSDKMINIDTRIITATNKDLESKIKNGTFRSDLYYRLNVISVCIEPLRKRKEDILPLMSNFLGDKFNMLSYVDKNILYDYDWPGNIRELKNSAIHFDTLSTLPNYLISKHNHTSDLKPSNFSQVSDSDIKIQILKIIMENTHLYHGIGRSSINNYLKAMNIHIGDASLRILLKEMHDEGSISIGSGRTGTKITDIGINKLKMN